MCLKCFNSLLYLGKLFKEIKKLLFKNPNSWHYYLLIFLSLQVSPGYERSHITESLFTENIPCFKKLSMIFMIVPLILISTQEGQQGAFSHFLDRKLRLWRRSGAFRETDLSQDLNLRSLKHITVRTHFPVPVLEPGCHSNALTFVLILVRPPGGLQCHLQEAYCKLLSVPKFGSAPFLYLSLWKWLFHCS